MALRVCIVPNSYDPEHSIVDVAGKVAALRIVERSSRCQRLSAVDRGCSRRSRVRISDSTTSSVTLSEEHPHAMDAVDGNVLAAGLDTEENATIQAAPKASVEPSGA